MMQLLQKYWLSLPFSLRILLFSGIGEDFSGFFLLLL
jgi:hypothetical protein